MKTFKIITAIFILLQIYSCIGKPSSQTTPADTTLSSTDEASSPLIDTGKLQSDLNDIITSVISAEPDTTKLKNAASDIMMADAKILSDSGIDKMYGNSNNPAVKVAANTLKKMRNGIGLTPGKLDSMKKEAEKLSSNH